MKLEPDWYIAVASWCGSCLLGWGVGCGVWGGVWGGRLGVITLKCQLMPLAYPVSAYSMHAHRWYSIDHVRLWGSWYVSRIVGKFTHADQVTSSEGMLFCDILCATCSWCYALNLLKQTFIPSSFPRRLVYQRQEHPELHKFLYGYCWRQSWGPLTLRNFWKKSAKQWTHANASETRGKSASATPSEEMQCKKKRRKSSFPGLEKAFFFLR